MSSLPDLSDENTIAFAPSCGSPSSTAPYVGGHAAHQSAITASPALHRPLFHSMRIVHTSRLRRPDVAVAPRLRRDGHPSVASRSHVGAYDVPGRASAHS